MAFVVPVGIDHGHELCSANKLPNIFVVVEQRSTLFVFEAHNFHIENWLRVVHSILHHLHMQFRIKPGTLELERNNHKLEMHS